MHVESFEPLATPVELARRLCDAPGLAWLDGEAPHADGRYSFLGVEPVERIERYADDPDPLRALDALEPEVRDAGTAVPAGPIELARVPRWIGYVAYDAAWCGRRARLTRPAQRPVLSFARYDALLAIEHGGGRAYLLGDDARACARLREQLLSRGRQPRARAGEIRVPPAEQHRAAISATLERIAAGDVYQVNLARCFRAPFEGDPLALWLGLRSASPVPFGFYFASGARVIAARTMERFLRWERCSGLLDTRPIKGTLRRSGQRDAPESATLRGDEKERAEHAMIVDLMRNDLGRVAAVGSVVVSGVMAVEPYAGLHHLVSTVRCRTPAMVSLRDVLEAAFPPGSVTGAPKLAAIGLIEALEPEPRDVYTGALGFVDREGGLSLAVGIRCAQLDGDEVRYFAGGGIVEASDPEREIAETELKAEVFRAAIAALR